jgi:hypothetical protein
VPHAANHPAPPAPTPLRQALFALSPLAVSHGATAASSPEQQAAAVAALAVCPSRVPAARRLALRTAHTASHLVHSGRAIADAVSDNGGVHPAVELLALTMLCRAPDARDAVIGMPVPLPALLQIVRQRDAITSRLALQLLETLMQGDLGAAPGHPGWPPPPQGPMRGAWPWGAASAAASAAIVAHGDAAGGEGAEVLRAGGAVILAAERARCGGGRACVVCGAPCRMRCSGCSLTAACSAECQRAAWQAHKPVCLAARQAAAGIAGRDESDKTGGGAISAADAAGAGRSDQLNHAAPRP